MKIILRIWIIAVLSLLASSTLWAQAPPPPDMLSVSVDPSNNATTVKWRQMLVDPSLPIVRYIISELEYPRIQPTPAFYPIDSVNIPAVSYTNTSAAVTKVNLSTQAFTVLSRSSVSSANVSPRKDVHFTMFLLPASTDTCAMTASLKWRRYKATNYELKEPTNYKQFNDSIKYEVWGYQSNAPFSQASAVLMSGRIKDTTFTTSALQSGVNYYFFIKAYLPNGEESSSNRISAEVGGNSVPLAIHISKVDATGPGATLNFSFTDNPFVTLYPYSCIVERSNNLTTGFTKIGEFNGSPTSYVDNGTDPGKVNYYRISALKCGQPMMTSDTISTIVLTAKLNGESSELSWTEFSGQTVNYDIKRVQPDNTQITTGLTNRDYTDNVSTLIQQGYDNFCYQITGYSANQTSISAQQCTMATPLVYMPDAVDPTSSVTNATTGRKRSEFGPIINTPETNYGYHLVVFNRWNIKVFETSKNIGNVLKPKDFWNGTYEGKIVPPGLYMYTISVHFNNGTTNLKGTVTVVY